MCRRSPARKWWISRYGADTPARKLDPGWVVIGDGRTITTVTSKRPEGVRVHRTDGVILPGMIDLHGHPEFNVFAPWEPPRQFVNRYAWRASDRAT